MSEEERLALETLLSSYGRLLLIHHDLRDQGFTWMEIERIMKVMESVCHDCLDENKPCQCWNDE